MKQYNTLFIEEKLPIPLNKEELYNLFKEYKNGNSEAKDKIIIHNIKLVLSIVNSNYKNTPYETNELVSVGLIGLIKSVETFDISKKIEFSTYSIKCIQNEILQFIRKNKRHIENQTVMSEFPNDSINEKNIKTKEIHDNSIDIIKEYEKKETIRIIREIVLTLNDREREIMMLKFGFYNDTEYTQVQISRLMNIPQPTISRIIKKTLIIISEELKRKELIELRTKRRIIK